jgi:ribosomal RNA assembly protein
LIKESSLIQQLIKMQQIYSENLGKILKNKFDLEKSLDIKIKNQGKNIIIDGNTEDEFIALKVLEAMELGFSCKRALLLKNPEIMLHIIHIKDLTKRNDLERIRARIIGTNGKTIANLYNLSDCFISVNENDIGIIGETEYIKEAIIAIKLIIQGSKQANVYRRLEKKKKEKRLAPIENIKNEFIKKNKQIQ